MEGIVFSLTKSTLKIVGYIKKWQFSHLQMLQISNLQVPRTGENFMRKFKVIQYLYTLFSRYKGLKLRLKLKFWECQSGVRIFPRESSFFFTFVTSLIHAGQYALFLFHFFGVSCCNCFCFVCYFLNLVVLFVFCLVL